MKNFLFVPLALIAFGTQAQSTIQLKNAANGSVVAAGSTINLATQAVSNVKFTFDLKNTSATTQTYTAKRYDILLNTAVSQDYPIAKAYFCFAGNCYNELTFVSPNNLVLNSGQSASEVQGQYQMLVADLDECDDVGESIIRYTFKNVNNSADSAQVTLDYNNAVWLGVKEATKNRSGLSVWPNPSSNGLVRLKADQDFSKVEVINQLGSVVYSKAVTTSAGQLELDLSSMPVGVYFVKASAGEYTATQKLVITGR